MPQIWKVITVILAVLVIVLAGTLVLVAPMKPTTETRVDWFNYNVTAGPGIVTNVTTVSGMCAPSDATTVGVFSMIWSTSTGKPVELVRLWTVEGSTTPVVVNLYVAWNASSGGTSFLAAYPTPCSLVWHLTAASNQTVTVIAIATLTYNVTVQEPLL